MTEEMKKPEWFELTDKDAPSTQVTKVNKKLPIAAVLITGAVIATGAFFASASENDASAEGITQTVASSTASSAPATTSSATPSTSTSPGIQDPTQGGVPAPGTRGGDDDGDHQWGEGRSHDGDREGGHEGREGHDDRD